MKDDPLVDQLLLQVPLNRDVRWTAESLGLSERSFDEVAQRVLELEDEGAVDIINLSRDSAKTSKGKRRLNAIRFMRLG
ncbi:hypothetical protein [Pseudoxanthomonas dokdonensis]|nr:hypothetical protein [Pseudoxanthomonas dokdonensis]